MADNPGSLRDALRTFFQPIKTDDTRLDLYTMYEKESDEYGMDYVKKYDEDLNTTLISVRFSLYALSNFLTWFVGWPVLCSQFGVRHRRLPKTTTGSHQKRRLDIGSWSGSRRTHGNLP